MICPASKKRVPTGEYLHSAGKYINTEDGSYSISNENHGEKAQILNIRYEINTLAGNICNSLT